MDIDNDMQNISNSSHRLFVDQVHKLFEHSVFGTFASLFCSILLVFILRNQIAHAHLLTWLVCAGILSVGRVALFHYYFKSPTRNTHPEKWYRWFSATLFLSGILYGSTSIFIFITDSIGHQAFILLLVGGMIAGAASLFSAALKPFFLFSITAGLPACICFFIIGNEMHITIGVMSVLFMLIMCLAAARMSKNIRHLLSLMYERSALITNLREEVDQRKEAQESLRRQKGRVEEIVTQRTAQLKNANQRLHAILNYAPLVIWAFDQQGILTFADGKGMEKIGFEREKSVGLSIFEMFSSNKPFIDITQRVLNAEFISDTIIFNNIFFEIRYQPVVDTNDYLIGAIGVAIDVTEQTIAKEALNKSKEQYQELVENINDVLYAIDKNGSITYISPVIESILGYSTKELTGKSIFDLIDSQDQERIKKDFNQPKDMVGNHRDYRFIKKTGEETWCRVSSRPIRNGHKKVGVQGVLVDINWSKRLEEKLQNSQKMEALGTLAGGVAHDLNNILSGIISIPELLMMDLPDDSHLLRPLTIIRESGENAAAVVQDLLTMARRGVPTHESININQVINKCLDSPDIDSYMRFHPKISLKTNLQSDLLNVFGSYIHIFKSISNLVANAVEAMPKGGCIEISTSNRYVDSFESGFDTVTEGEYVVLSISDSGVGIAEKDQAKIFEPFYTKKVMGRSGSGLGMAVVWGTMKDHNGYIDLKSKEGQGTQFELLFPATRNQPKDEENPVKPLDFQGNGELILVVDDMPAQREIATSILDRLGYRSKSLASGEEAIDYLRYNNAELMILDMILDPGIDGYETYRQIKSFRPAQKAIIASGYSETEGVNKTLDLGAGKCIQKPYTLTTIGQAIKDELRK